MNHADVKRRFGDALARALASAGVSQTALARRLGHKPGTVSAWVRGSNACPLADALAIDAALGRRVGSLLDDARLTQPAVTVLEAIETADSLDEQAKDELRLNVVRLIGETARRRAAANTPDGETTSSVPVSLVSDRSPVGVMLLQLFGRDEVRRLADVLAEAAS